MTNILSCLVRKNLPYVLSLMLLVLSFSCSSQGDSNDPIEKLAAYCIRECVLETSDSEICDTECKCAADKLSQTFSKDKFSKLVNGLTETNAVNPDSISELRKAFEICRTEVK